jgi:Protein of unknown function, DUF547
MKMKNFKKLQITILLVMISMIANAEQPIDVFFKKSDLFFKSFVTDSKVDYLALNSDATLLNETLEIAAKIDVKQLDQNNYKAFWINTYNLLVIKGIVDNYPVKSVQDIKGFFDKKNFDVAQQRMSLKKIEETMLKKVLKDPFLNFVLVCASNGCPPLIDKAYLPETIDKQLEEQTRISINNPNFIRVNKETKTIEVSEMFEWYREDFINNEYKVITFLNKYRTDKIDENWAVEYYKYDWTLNSKK